jgi:bilirubin oxidase
MGHAADYFTLQGFRKVCYIKQHHTWLRFQQLQSRSVYWLILTGKYDIAIALTSKRYNADGSLWSPEKNGEVQNLFGDIIQANGQPWPYLRVEPRKYRLRFLNAAASRTWQLYFQTAAGARANMKVVGSDAGLLLNPVDTTQLDTSIAERWEVVFDFAPERHAQK